MDARNQGTALPAEGIVGIDIGGTKIAGLLVDGQGVVLARGSVPAPASEGGAAMADAAAGLARDLAGRARATLVAAGVGAAGVIDHETGAVRAASATFAGWAGFPLAEELASRLSVPVSVENDVNAFLLGEVAGAYRAEQDVLGIMLGTGVGGAVIIAGELRHGPNGAAGEIGHTPGYSDLVCTCGQTGHLETLASGTSIGLRYASRAGGAVLDARAVANLARSGDADATAVFRAAGRAVALACASAATLLDLPRAIVGGGVAEAWDLLEPAIEETLRTDAPVSGLPLRITPATRGTDAVALGAIESVRRALTPAGAR
ncbi:ROK family protein [Microbacterium hydrocarbonoxydans]|uniref:ROK family protein n=1 Tax=Microbacterium hydrocarbonoxydans TaxID=273678 RepID=UPI0007BBB152|nr:ROK family protein [Microbacterium hydrocarbonoxydans]GAT72918.1 sugar kinase [Microbacterium sp. HM58-2]